MTKMIKTSLSWMLTPVDMMILHGLVLVGVLSSVSGIWMDDLAAEKGLDVGAGFKVRLEKQAPIEGKNFSLWDTHRLRINYNGLALSVGKVPENDVVQVGLYYEDDEKGRSRRIGQLLFPIVMGFKVTGLTAAILIGVALFVTKAFFLAKLALWMSLGLLLSRVLHSEPKMEHIELDHHPSEMHQMYAYPSGYGYETVGNGYANDGTHDEYGTVSYGTTSSGQETLVAESTGQYSVVAPSNATSDAPSTPADETLAASKRHDSIVRKKYQLLPTYIRVKEYNIER